MSFGVLGVRFRFFFFFLGSFIFSSGYKYVWILDFVGVDVLKFSDKRRWFLNLRFCKVVGFIVLGDFRGGFGNFNVEVEV